MLTTKAGELIRRAREDVGMTQAQLASAAGVQQPTISAYESGRKKPRPETLERILRAARARPSLPLMVYANDIRLAAGEFRLSRVRVFGSAVHGLDTEGSDIDLLVGTDAGTTLFDLARFTERVGAITGFGVDVVTEQQMSTPLLAHVLDEAVPL